MCYKACFYNGGHGRKDIHIIIFARAYKDGKRKGPIRKQQTEKQGKTEKKQVRRTTGTGYENTNHRALKSADSAKHGEGAEEKK